MIIIIIRIQKKHKWTKQPGVEPILIDSTGGTEPSWWREKSQGHTVCAGIGPTVENVHNTTETLYIHSIVPVYKNILNVIEKVVNRK